MKKIFSKLVIFILILCLFISCATPLHSAYMKEGCQAFIGVHDKEIVATLSAPDEKQFDDAGGTILIYEKDDDYIHFYIDKNGICYDTETNNQEIIRKILNHNTTKAMIIGLPIGIVLGVVFGVVQFYL